MSDDLDQIWKALADETRRGILDMLRIGPRTTTEIVERFPTLTRFAVLKHLDVLRQAALVVTREEGRRRINSINAVPLRMIYERWVSNFEDQWSGTLLRIKESAERAVKPRGTNVGPKKNSKPAAKRRRRPSSSSTNSSAK